MIVGTAGHIDHGKTSLVKALTAIDCDRLPEEKARGITIELGFAYWPRPSGATIGFVDVPGHEKLVHTMLAGATGIDAVVLVVAADDGVMPQTREHLAIIDLLGLGRGVVALTKCDLADAALRARRAAEIGALLSGTGLDGAPVIPVSSVTGEGLAALAFWLDGAAAATSGRRADGRFRLAVDRVFTLKGTGTVVTGTVLSGRVAVGDQVVTSPGGLAARVRSLHAQGAAAEGAAAGMRCALALTGSGVSTEAIARGEVVSDPALHAPARRIDASLRLLAAERRALGQWAPVRLHHASAEVTGRVLVLSADALAPGGEGFVQLVLDAPLAAASGDRFVIRDISATRTLGGGTLLDLAAPERRRRAPERLAELAALRDLDEAGALDAILAARGWIDPVRWVRERAAAPGALDTLRARLVVLEAGAAGAAAMSPDDWDAFAAEIGARLDAVHAERPDEPGLGQERLRLALRPRLPAPLFAAAVARLAAAGVLAAERGWLRRPWHEVRLSPGEEALWAAIRPLLGGAERFRPPRVRDIAKARDLDEGALRRLFRLAARRGDVEEVARDHFFLAATVAEMAGIARDLAATLPENRFAVTDFRDRLDNGRKVAIQILEFFDRQGLTMRRGDIRRINPHRSELYAPPPGAPVSGGESSPVGRPDFKSGWGRETVPGGFDSRLLRQTREAGPS